MWVKFHAMPDDGAGTFNVNANWERIGDMMEENRKTLEHLLRKDIFAGREETEVVRELLVRLPKEQEGYWEWENLEEPDMEMLEASMRQWEKALEILADMDGVELEYQLASMQFQLLNVILFYKYEMVADARVYTEKVAKNALDALKRLVDGRMVADSGNGAYAVRESWNCVLLFCTLFELAAKQADMAAAASAVKTASEYMKKLKPYLAGNPELCDAAARRFWSMSGVLSGCGDAAGAGELLAEAGELYYELSERYGNAYAKAMYLHVKVMNLIPQMAVGNANTRQLEQIRDEAWKLRCMPDATEFEKKIADELDIMTMMCVGFVKLAEKNLSAADSIFKAQEEEIRDCIPYFDQLSVSENPWMAYLGADFAKRLRGFRISCALQSAQCDYFMGALPSAKRKFEKTLELMEENPEAMPEVERLRAMSMIFGMLGDTCGQSGDLSQAEFYFDRNVTVSETLANQTKLNQDWGNYAHSCLFAMEFLLQLRKNEEAKPYAEKGLRACEEIRSQDSGNEALSLEPKFEKALTKKKGLFSRWF